MNLKHYLIAITLCAPYLLSLLGCKNHQDANERDLLTIHIKDYENKTIPRPAVISNIDTIELDTHGYFMSDIKTVCISDTMAYVADRANTVWAFKPVGRLRQTHPERGARKRGICLGLDLDFGRQPPVRNGL